MTKKHKNNKINENKIISKENIMMQGIISITPQYEALILENTRLRQRVAELENTNSEMTLRIIEKNREIEVLKQENEVLRNRINELENKVHEQDAKIKLIETQLLNIEMREQKKKIIIAIQDLNSLDKLEHKLGQYNHSIHMLRENRTTECHYIKIDDSDEIKNYKKLLLLDKLNNLDKLLINKIDGKHKGFINKIKCYIEMQNITYQNIDEDTKDDINSWWLDD